ncbi:alpha/beta fold hydrolase [Spirillospora sp. NPDC050679]
MAERRILVQGKSTAYFEEGQGPVVLFVHGNATSARDWWKVMHDLSSTHRVVALSLPGYGSTSPLDDVRPARLASFIEAFLDALEVEEVIAVGHSYGGLLAAEFALARPRRVTRLVLADSAGMGRAVGPAVVSVALLPPPVAKLVITALLLPGGALLRTLSTGVQLRRPWRVPLATWVDQARLTRSRTFLTTAYEVVRAGVGPGGQRFTVSARLDEITVPTLVLWGLTDELFPLWQAFAAVRKLPQGRLAVLTGAGHICHLDSHEDFMGFLGPFVRDDIEALCRRRGRMRDCKMRAGFRRGGC